MACENCDYVDLMMPVDYLPAAFDFGNRKQYHQWKMVGIQGTYDNFFSGKNNDITGGAQWGIAIDSSGRLVGVGSGCKVIEEVNQNNHIVGRGAWYFRAKSDGDGNKSAAYGIMGHCQSPGISEDAMFNQKPTAYQLEGHDTMVDEGYWSISRRTPMFRYWGKYQNNVLCSTSSASTNWRMGAFIEETYTDDQGKEQTRVSMQYAKDTDCALQCKGLGEACLCACEARNSRLPGRFTSWICTDNLEKRIFRTCEAELPLTGERTLEECRVCFSKIRKYVLENTILGTGTGDDPKDYGDLQELGIKNQAPFRLESLDQGVMIKLTSLPSCNHFDKIFRTKVNDDSTKDPFIHDICYNQSHPSYNPNDENCYMNIRCERGVIRIAPSCIAAVSASPKGGKAIGMGMYYGVQEVHYDRWDMVNERGADYKIFDEIFDVPEFKYRVRVLAHKKDILDSYFDQSNGFVKDQWMKKKYSTGGKVNDYSTSQRGCQCKNENGNNSAYPIRPYNSYTYCPNNFTCEKTCTGTEK